MNHSTKVKIFFTSGGIFLPFTFSVLHAKEIQKKTNPNVIFILADDMGIGDLGCYGQKIIRTPAIDNLAKNGMLFTQHYSGSTVSAPSRCSLMTGKNTGHTYVRGNQGFIAPDGREYDTPLPKSETTVAEIFKRQNYTTACFGKWGLGGPNTIGSPTNKGFDYFFGYLGQGDAHETRPEMIFENNTAIMLNRKVYAPDLIMNKAIEFIDKNSDSPFFIYLAPTTPHAELAVPDGEMMGYDGKFPEIPFAGQGNYGAQAQPKATYAAMVTRLDRDIQKIVDLLKKKGLLENTLIIFTSDNGAHKEGGNDPDFFDSNGPYRGYKRDLYEGGIRTPFIAQWPKVIKAGTTSNLLSAFWDFLPTVCEIIGEPKVADINGISYLSSLKGKTCQKKHSSMYFEFHEGGGKQAILKGGWKLIKLQVNDPEKTKIELYHYSKDISEKNNVATQYPEKVKQLTNLMNTQRSESDIWEFKTKN